MLLPRRNETTVIVMKPIDTLEDLRRKRSVSEAEIIIAKFADHHNHFFGLSTLGELVILFSTEDIVADEFKIAEFPRYKHMRVQLDQKLKVELDNLQATERTFHILSLKSEDVHIQNYFLQYMQGVVHEIGDNILFRDLVPLLKSALSLFRLVNSPPKIELQGLWAELMLIAASSDPETLAKEWHVSNSSLWDFQSKDRVIEVKSIVGKQRIHHFKNDQLHPPKNVNTGVVASFVLTRTDDGESIWDLIKEINRKVSAEYSFKIRKLVHELLGNRLAQSETVKFDRNSAISKCHFYSMDSISRFEQEAIPPEMSEVHFKMNLTGIPELVGFSL